MFVNESDPSTVVVGTDLLSGSLPVANCGLSMGYTDAATFTSLITVTLSGRNQFGELVTEELTLDPPSATPIYVQSVHAYSQIDSIIPTVATNLVAADTLTIGCMVNDAAKPLVLGLPGKVGGLNEIVGGKLIQFLVPSAMGTHEDIVTLNTTYHTVTVADTSTGGAAFYAQLNPVAGIETR